MIKQTFSEVRPKDFLLTRGGLVFAVVSYKPEDGRFLSFLRYIRSNGGNGWQKVGTDQANSYLRLHYPDYLIHSRRFDADLHGVPNENIYTHYQPRRKLQDLLERKETKKKKRIDKLVQLVKLLIDSGISRGSLGITGSYLIGAENENSDFDLVVYDRDSFEIGRELIKILIKRGKLASLDHRAWISSYNRRGCSLSLEEYIWHERRKYNKALFQGVKFDISLVTEAEMSSDDVFHKSGHVTITTTVRDASQAFETPAIYLLDHPVYRQLICFTPTYSGQAMRGEKVEIAALVEKTEDGSKQRLVVGSSREAAGEYIKVIR